MVKSFLTSGNVKTKASYEIIIDFSIYTFITLKSSLFSGGALQNHTKSSSKEKFNKNIFLYIENSDMIQN